MMDPLQDDYGYRDIEEHNAVRPVKERRVVGPERDSLIAITAIKWTAVVIIVIAILYFLAIYILPALIRRP